VKTFFGEPLYSTFGNILFLTFGQIYFLPPQTLLLSYVYGVADQYCHFIVTEIVQI